MREIGASADKPDKCGLSPARVTRIFRKSVFTKPSAGRNGGPGLLLAKTDALTVEGAGQIVEQLLDFDFSRNELMLQRIGDDGLQRRAACVWIGVGVSVGLIGAAAGMAANLAQTRVCRSRRPAGV